MKAPQINKVIATFEHLSNPLKRNRRLLFSSFKKNHFSKETLLSNLTPFDWDVVFVFPAGTDKKLIDRLVGSGWDIGNKTPILGEPLCLFTNCEEAVCSLWETNIHFEIRSLPKRRYLQLFADDLPQILVKKEKQQTILQFPSDTIFSKNIK